MRSNRTMDALPEAPPSYEQVITQKLVRCGLSAHDVRVSYESYLQSYEIVISRSAKATPAMFDCIRESAGAEIVTFDDNDSMRQYYAYLEEAYRPEALARAEADLTKRGLLLGFPKRADFVNDALFAEALEAHCGLTKGEAIRPFGKALAFQPPPESMRNVDAFTKRYSCLLSAIQLVSAKGELEVGFIGNEAFAAPD